MADWSSKTVAAGAGAALAALSTAIYANDHYAISHDIRELRKKKSFVDRMQAKGAEFGENLSLYRMLQLAQGDAEGLWFEGRTWKFSEILMEVDKIATFFHRADIRPGDSVAVFMTNSPETVFTHYALSKLGAVMALINTSLRSLTLAHCVEIAGSKSIICTPDLALHVLDLFSETGSTMPCISINLSSFPALQIPIDNPHSGNVTQLRYEDMASITDIEPRVAAERKMFDIWCFIYTSGTSGKPKAVAMRNFTLLWSSIPSAEDYENSCKDLPMRIFCALPIFHATGLIIGFYSSLGTNSTFCLARKFSVSTFSQQLFESKATRMLYIGEMCRYLLKPPPSKFDKAHQVRIAIGNGLQKDVWNKFKERYNITEIREFYRSTEGIPGFMISTKRPQDAGFVARDGPIARYFEDTTYLVKHDAETDAPWRDPVTGLCKLAAVNEPGEAIGRVMSMETYREYRNNPEANEKKMLRDVFKKGDLFQRTGDLLVRNEKGMIKFADRTGDTYRWNGENVSAGEVREHITLLPSVHDASVYGMNLDSYDGQAGAAGIMLLENSEQSASSFMHELASNLRRTGLTNYQMPRLVRLTQDIDTTATFKHAKTVLKTRSWDPSSDNTHGDRLFWLDGDSYKELDSSAWTNIQSGKARL